jgi:RNA polymerase II subunit A small phosphatase-like protein
VVNGEESKEAAAPESTPKPQPKKGPSKLLAFLGCCSSADVDTDDTTVPPKKTNRQQPASNRLPTPDKADTHTADSSTAESREPYFDEKAHSTVSADQPGEEERNVHATATGAQSEGPSAAVQSEASGQSKPEVPAPVESADANGSVDEIKPEEYAEDLDAQTKSIEEPAPSTAPTKSLADDQPEPNQADIVTQAPMVLPPPPPVPAPPARAVSEDGMRPLLPAPLPHLSGRKCLVLDLDETLVHSSFKVTIFVCDISCSSANLNIRFLSVPTSPFLWKSKDNTTTSMSSSDPVWINS